MAWYQLSHLLRTHPQLIQAIEIISFIHVLDNYTFSTRMQLFVAFVLIRVYRKFREYFETISDDC